MRGSEGVAALALVLLMLSAVKVYNVSSLFCLSY